MGAQQTKIDYNYGLIIPKQDLCVKIMQYDVIGKDVFFQTLQQTAILKSIKEIDKITFCGSPSEIKATFQYHQITLHQFILNQDIAFKETQLIIIIRAILQQLNQNKIQIHPREILLPDYAILDPEIFLQKSDIQRLRQGLIKQQDYYLAPEILIGKWKSNIQAQIFSLGLICLFIMTKQTPYEIGLYDNKSMFQELNLEKYINKFDTGLYSQLLKQLLIDMLAINPKDRVKDDQISARLDEITNFHQQKTLKFQDSLDQQQNEELRQSEVSYNYKERPSELPTSQPDRKYTAYTIPNSPTNSKNRNKENIEVEFITKKKQNYSFSACSSRSHIRGFSVKPANKQVCQQQEKLKKQKWK